MAESPQCSPKRSLFTVTLPLYLYTNMGWTSQVGLVAEHSSPSVVVAVCRTKWTEHVDAEPPSQCRTVRLMGGKCRTVVSRSRTILWPNDAS